MTTYRRIIIINYVTQFLNVLFNHKRVCIDEQSLCDSDSNQFLPQFLLRYNTDNDLSILKHIHFISERLIDTDKELLKMVMKVATFVSIKQ